MGNPLLPSNDNERWDVGLVFLEFKERFERKYGIRKKNLLISESPPLGIIPILAMTAVLRNDADASRHQFMLRYQSRTRVKDLYLQRVDRDRDLWVDGLYEFIQMVRDDYQRTNKPDDKRKKLLQQPKGKTLTSPIIQPHKTVPEIDSTTETRIPLFSPGKTRVSSSAVVGDMMKWLNDPEELVESVDHFVRAKNHEDIRVIVGDFSSESSPLLKE